MITTKSKSCNILKVFEINMMLTFTNSTASLSAARVSCILDQSTGAVKHVSINVNYAILHNEHFFPLDSKANFIGSCQRVALRNGIFLGGYTHRV